MKNIYRIILSLVLIFAFFSFSLSTFALEKEYEWFCIRSGNLQPPVTKREEILSKYNSFSLDRSVRDSSDKKVLYLTFDAGYENGNVERILDTLKEENVCAAFFVLDNIIVKNTDIVTRMTEEGHLVCNHTKNHKNLSFSSFEDIKKDICELESIYKECTGKELSKFFRFPEGKYSENALESIDKLGYKTVFWSFAYDDWDNNRQMSAQKAKRIILSNTHNGAIILLHPTSRVNAEILPDVIRQWKKMGYSFGSLEDIK